MVATKSTRPEKKRAPAKKLLGRILNDSEMDTSQDSQAATRAKYARMSAIDREIEQSIQDVVRSAVEDAAVERLTREEEEKEEENIHHEKIINEYQAFLVENGDDGEGE